MEEIIIDASNCIAGKLATFAAKQAILGKKVSIVNAEKAIISGNPRYYIEKWKKLKFEYGSPRAGPYISHLPDRFLRLIIRRMIKKRRSGREAYKRVLCYINMPKEFEGKEIISLERAKLSERIIKSITVGELCKELGWKGY